MRPIDHLFAQLDACRSLSPTHPARMAALDRVWFALFPEWQPVAVEADCVPF
jgi:hypothetical protein